MPKETTARHSPASLRNLATQLKENAVLMEAGADALKLLNVERVTIKHAKSADTAMVGLEAFIRAMREAIRESGTEPVSAKKKRVRSGDTTTDR